MITGIVLLRGINVGGHRKLPMAELRDLLSSLGYTKSATYIQSGNVLVQCDEKKWQSVNTALKKAIHNKFGYDVPVVSRTLAEWNEIIRQNPFIDDQDDLTKLLVTILDDTPIQENAADLEAYDFGSDELRVLNSEVYMHCRNGAGKSKITNNILEKKLKVMGTTRNWKSMLKLHELATNM